MELLSGSILFEGNAVIQLSHTHEDTCVAFWWIAGRFSIESMTKIVKQKNPTGLGLQSVTLWCHKNSLSQL